jgi:hypothetical protein
METSIIYTRSIISRKSIRTYTGEKITEDQEKKILDYISNEKNLIGLKGNKMRIEFKEISESVSGRIGTYGMVKNAPSFLICICRNDLDSLLDCGYVFEKLILFLRNIDLGTCWLGGSFNRDKLTGNMEIGDDEFIPIITPVGKGTEKFSIKERLVRKSIKANNRLDFDKLFYKSDFSNRIEDEMTREILEMVRLAPSASNKQPWRIVMDDENTAHFYIERTPGYGKGKLGYDIQWLDIGIAISHYVLVKGGGVMTVDPPKIDMISENHEYVASIK